MSFSGKRERRTKHKSRMRGGREQQREALRVRLLPTLRGRVFHLTKLNSNLKASELFRRTYFQIKVIKSGMISDLRESRRGVFAATAHHDVGARFFMLFPYFIYIAHLTKFTRGALCLWKNLCSGKIKGGRKSSVKKKRPLKKERKKKEYHSVQKRNSFVKATGTVGAPH